MHGECLAQQPAHAKYWMKVGSDHHDHDDAWIWLFLVWYYQPPPFTLNLLPAPLNSILE